MLSLLARLVGWEQSIYSQDHIDIEEIQNEFSSETEWEEKIHSGKVTEVRTENSLVDGEYWMAGQSVGRIGGGEGKMGDRVCVKLARKKGSEGQWVVKELLQVIRGEDSWDEESKSSEENSPEEEYTGLKNQTLTKVCCTVSSVSGSRVEVTMPAREIKRFSLVKVWKSNLKPMRGDLVEVTLGLVSEDLEDLEGSEVLGAKPARVLDTHASVTSWDPRRREGLVRGDIFLSESVCTHGYRPRVGDSVHIVAVECVWGDGWRCARAVLREGRQGQRYHEERRTDQGLLIRGQTKTYKGRPNFRCLKLDEYPVPPSLCDPYISTPAILYPQLTQPLSASNYSSKLHTLLHLESVSAQHSLARHSMTSVALHSMGPYLALTVPGLQDRRPGLVQGDSVILSSPGNATQYEGCIHEVRKDSLMLKFSSQFHFSYCGETYDVSFLLSRTQVRRQHRALEMAETQLGFDVLIPCNVVKKAAQINVIDSQKFVMKSLPQKVNMKGSSGDGKPFQKLVRDCGGRVDSDISVVSNESIEKDCDIIDQTRTRVLSPDVKLKIMSKLASLPPPHPLVKPRRIPGSGPDNLRRKVLLSSLPATTVDVASPLWSVPSLPNLKPSSPPSQLLSVLPNSFSLPSSPVTPYYPLPPPAITISWVNTALNCEQRRAVINILSGFARPVPYILYGPPGTGKTVTLVEAILQTFLLREDSRVLVCTPSNSSADLVTSRLVESGKIVFGDLARLNAFQRSVEAIPEKILPYCFLPEEEVEQLDSVARHRLVVTTCSTAGNLYRLGLSSSHFTHVFIDEAGHVTEPEVLVPLCLLHSSVGQVVLAGDPQQLGPTITSSMATMYGLGQSMLERLSSRPIYLKDDLKFGEHGGYDPMVLTKLVRNYRSHEDILSIPSKLFYDSELVACASQAIKNRFCGDTLGTLLPNKEHPVIFHGVHGDCCQEPGSTSWHNPQEVWQVVKYVKELEVVGVRPEEIGIIAPYRAQCAHIRDMMASLGMTSTGLKVGSVEEFQGQERPVIILTTVRSKEYSDSRLGFLTSEKRLNVAITRAQGLLVVVGDPDLLSTHPAWQQLLHSVSALGGYTGCVSSLE